MLVDRRGRTFASYEAFCVEPQPFGLGYRIADIERIIGERTAQSAKDRAEKAKAASDVGAPTGNKNATKVEPQPVDDLPLMQAAAKNESGNTRFVSPGKRKDADYLTARIARDRPDILERMRAGEFPSVRKAALEAGIVKPEFSCPCDPQRAARRILNRFQGEALAELVRLLANHAGIEAGRRPRRDGTTGGLIGGVLSCPRGEPRRRSRAIDRRSSRRNPDSRREVDAMDTDRCPKCDAATVMAGRLIAGRGAVGFKPPGERFVWWGLPTPPPAVSKDCRVCLTCGFVWAHLRLEDLHAYIDKSCDDETRRKLSPFRKAPPEQDLI